MAKIENLKRGRLGLYTLYNFIVGHPSESQQKMALQASYLVNFYAVPLDINELKSSEQ